MLTTKAIYSIANTYNRKDIEEEVERITGISSFAFEVKEHELGNYLSISSDYSSDEKLCTLIGAAVDDIHESEDLAFSLIRKITNTQGLKQIILLQEDREILVLA